MFIYTLLGSLPMLVGVLGLGIAASTFNLDEIAQQAQAGTLHAPWWTLACFLFAFAIKAPIFPLHGWAPLTYREALQLRADGQAEQTAAFGLLGAGVLGLAGSAVMFLTHSDPVQVSIVVLPSGASASARIGF